MLSGVVMLIFSFVCGCDYGRMYDQDVVKPYGRKMPEMDARTIPVQDGFQTLVTADPKRLKNPLRYSKASVEQGALAYSYYCIQCHGPKADGNGTVGQSFVPLPADLSSSDVQGQKDGELYARIRLGFKRHPQLFSTVSEEDAWAVVIYIRSLKGESG
jgi:mono/diheme cytochrome c family protein